MDVAMALVAVFELGIEVKADTAKLTNVIIAEF